MPTLKSVRWIGSSREDLQGFPAAARRNIGYALHFAQVGDKHPAAKPLQGFGSAGVLEIVEDHDGNTYRAIYTVRFAERWSTSYMPFRKSRSVASKPLSVSWTS